jgi:predicted Ser/Thr protein kinase
MQCWIAPRDVKGGRPYSGQITQAIRDTKLFILVLSTASDRSKHVLREVDRADHCQNPILTFRIEPVHPGDDLDYFLGADQWVDAFRPSPPSEHFPRLIRYARELIQSNETASDGLDQSNTSVPEMFGHYRILRRPDGSRFELGRGGMGITYKALDTGLNRPVALKVIGADLLRSPQARRRFQREAQAAALIQHPHVATIYHFGESGGDYFYAMEFVEGEDLDRYVVRTGPLTIAAALRVVLQVAQALEAAQTQQLIHRDIKPANLMAVFNPAGLIDVKLIDFGLAKGAGTDGMDPSRVTRTQDFVGSPAFASPEQCDLKKLDIRSDIYSLGITLWYLIAGKPPFSGSVREVMNAQVGKVPPFDQLHGAPEPVIELLRRMVEKSPEGRYQTPRELRDAVEATAKQLPPETVGVVKENPQVHAGRVEEQIAAQDAPLDAYLEVKTGALIAGRYRLLEEAREGNGGRLFLARDEQAAAVDPAVVAVKLLHPNIVANTELTNLLEDELRVIFQAPHPNILRYFTMDRSGLCLIREWIHGFLLYDLLRWRRHLQATDLLSLLEPLPATLDFAADHGLGLVNVSIDKIIVTCPEAFSREEFQSLAKGDSSEWNRNALKLNPICLAPLLFKGRNQWDQKTMVPSSRILSATQDELGLRGSKAVRIFGKLVYELLSGRASVRSRANQSEYAPLPALDEAGNELLRRACRAEESADTYKNCQEFWESLKRHSQSSPFVRSGEGSPLRLPKEGNSAQNEKMEAAGAHPKPEQHLIAQQKISGLKEDFQQKIEGEETGRLKSGGWIVEPFRLTDSGESAVAPPKFVARFKALSPYINGFIAGSILVLLRLVLVSFDEWQSGEVTSAAFYCLVASTFGSILGGLLARPRVRISSQSFGNLKNRPRVAKIFAILGFFDFAFFVLFYFALRHSGAEDFISTVALTVPLILAPIGLWMMRRWAFYFAYSEFAYWVVATLTSDGDFLKFPVLYIFGIVPSLAIIIVLFRLRSQLR